ncbi:DUF397 domain-containing protein [Actinomadura sp. 21ATH]|uniref:DUF397 domain-containing protein n=1 Tax=Actinomadura sp. 21ATH TaxID=1735444 RepID=UPI0035C0A05C
MDLTGAKWRKSSYSSSNGGNCVELAGLPGMVAVRDSKDPQASGERDGFIAVPGGVRTVHPSAAAVAWYVSCAHPWGRPARLPRARCRLVRGLRRCHSSLWRPPSGGWSCFVPCLVPSRRRAWRPLGLVALRCRCLLSNGICRVFWCR